MQGYQKKDWRLAISNLMINMVQLTLYVNPVVGKDSAVGDTAAPLKTLMRALEQATAGMTIQLAAGTYDAKNGEVFPLSVPAGVIVRGNEAGIGKGILITGSGKYSSPTFNQQNTTLLLQSDAQLRGVTVTNAVKEGTGVWIESTSPILANNTFTNCGREAVFVTGTGKPRVFDNVFVKNASSGIFFVRNAKGEVRHNLCQETGYGIAVSDRAAPLLSDNQLIANRVGIFLSRNAMPVLRRNLIEKNPAGGLVITGDARPDLGSIQDPAGNILRDNGKVDLQNSSSIELISVGNQLNPARISGAVVLPVAEVNTPIMGPAQFRDVAGYWAEAWIQAVVGRRLLSGFPDGTFKPEASMTRAEYAAVIAKTFDLPRQRGTGTGVFSDVKAGFWAAAAIQKAANMGFISGFPDGTFRPGQNLTRVQALVSLVGGLGLKGGNPEVLGVYRDRAQIPSYATEAIATATQRQLVVNYPQPDALEPMRPITRAEVAALIYQVLVVMGKVGTLASPYLVNPNTVASSFIDIQEHWAAEFIRRLASLNLITGFVDGSFKPDAMLNRAQYAALLVKAFNPTPKRPVIGFIDIPANFWALAAIQDAYRSGFLSGFPDQTFQPQKPLRRLELILSLVNGLSLPPTDEKVLAIYKDRQTIPNYAASAITAATQASIIVNYPDPLELQLKREATRAEAAAMVHQALVQAGRLTAFNSPYIVSGLVR